MRRIAIFGLVFLALAGAARAEVTAVADNGFEVKHETRVARPPAEVYQALVRVGRWWDSNHSWSGDAANMTISPRPGECWCEAMPKGGAVRHLEVVAVEPGDSLRFYGGLGPLQFTGAAGHMTWKLEKMGEGTLVTWTYTVGGYAKDGFKTWAPAVDGVLGAALRRFKSYAETGKPA